MIHNSQNWIYGVQRFFGKEHTEVRSHLMLLSDELETYRFYHNSDPPQNGQRL